MTERELYLADDRLVEPGTDRRHDPFGGAAGGAAGAMDVVLGGVGQVVVQDVLDTLDVDAAGRDVRRHQDAVPTGAETLESRDPVLLRPVRVDARDAVLSALQNPA